MDLVQVDDVEAHPVEGPLDLRANVGGVGGFSSDGEYLPIVKVAPVYPRRAQTRGIEGFVLLEFTVTKTGAVKDPVVIDVSNSTDYAKGHIRGAMHMPPSRIESGNQELLKHRERPVLIYCRNNQVAPQMAGRLVKLGFTNVNVLAGGLSQWISDQQPVSRPKGAAKSDGGKGKGKGKRDKKAKGDKPEQATESE